MLRRTAQLITLLVICAACTGLPHEVPDDFTLHYGEYGVEGTREAVFAEEIQVESYSRVFESRKEYAWSSEERAALYAIVRDNKFFSLASYYETAHVLDGTVRKLFVRAAGKGYEVTVRNKRVERFDAVADAATALLEERADPWGYPTIEEQYMQCLQFHIDCASAGEDRCPWKLRVCNETEAIYERYATKNK